MFVCLQYRNVCCDVKSHVLAWFLNSLCFCGAPLSFHLCKPGQKTSTIRQTFIQNPKASVASIGSKLSCLTIQVSRAHSQNLQKSQSVKEKEGPQQFKK